jgi:hypothetical protein
MCIERLFQLINVVGVYTLWSTIKISGGGPHLLFAEATAEHVEIIQIVLDIFYQSSGQWSV